MELLESFAKTLQLDGTFFVQLAGTAVFYVVITRLFITPYLQRQKQREALTTDSLRSAEQLVKEAEQMKEQYEKKAAEAHREFQSVFQKIKEDVLQNHGLQVSALEKQQIERLKKARESLLQTQKEQERDFEKERNQLVKALTEKLAERG